MEHAVVSLQQRRKEILIAIVGDLLRCAPQQPIVRACRPELLAARTVREENQVVGTVARPDQRGIVVGPRRIPEIEVPYAGGRRRIRWRVRTVAADKQERKCAPPEQGKPPSCKRPGQRSVREALSTHPVSSPQEPLSAMLVPAPRRCGTHVKLCGAAQSRTQWRVQKGDLVSVHTPTTLFGTIRPRATGREELSFCERKQSRGNRRRWSSTSEHSAASSRVASTSNGRPTLQKSRS